MVASIGLVEGSSRRSQRRTALAQQVAPETALDHPSQQAVRTEPGRSQSARKARAQASATAAPPAATEDAQSNGGTKAKARAPRKQKPKATAATAGAQQDLLQTGDSEKTAAPAKSKAVRKPRASASAVAVLAVPVPMPGTNTFLKKWTEATLAGAMQYLAKTDTSASCSLPFPSRKCSDNLNLHLNSTWN